VWSNSGIGRRGKRLHDSSAASAGLCLLPLQCERWNFSNVHFGWATSTWGSFWASGVEDAITTPNSINISIYKYYIEYSFQQPSYLVSEI
jgi:hypothetical protein